MKLSLLLDLDDTLLGNDIRVFLPEYLKRLGQNFPNISPEQFSRKLLSATQGMISKKQSMLTLEQTFDQIFYPSLGINKADIIETLENFYANEFGQLSYLTQRRPEAIFLVDQALKSGFDVVIATNPIFPQSAIRQRMHWAGLEDELPIRLVTSFEKFHFAKPNPAYYAEILAQLGCPEQPAAMVGNSLEDDLIPAAMLGIPGYLVADKPVSVPPEFEEMIQQGPLSCVWAWANQIASQRKPFSPSVTIPGILASLKATPAALETISEALSAEEWIHQPTNQDWAIVEIMCHLRDADHEVNLPRLHSILQEDTPFLPGIVTDPWALERDYLHQSGPLAMKDFMKVRNEITTLLSDLSLSDWTRPAQHAIFGPTSITELFGFTMTHDIVHIRQVFQNITSAKQMNQAR